MAVAVTVEGKVLAKYKKLPDRLRSQLRGDLPDIVRDVRDAVAAKLAPGALFKTTTHLLPALSSQMVENANEIYGRVYIDADKFPAVVAHTLESGSVAHTIPKGELPYPLVFFWEKLGRVVAFKSVWHPGFEGRSYMASTLSEQADMIKQRLNKSVLEALNE
jgi:hypothetical protein